MTRVAALHFQFFEIFPGIDIIVGKLLSERDDQTSAARRISASVVGTCVIRETTALLKIDNVRLSDRHALVDGTLGSDNVHLGSGTVHRQPGDSLCIIPVQSQHRGQIFLPFADDNQKNAEIVSKVLLLARDQSIQDPTILEKLALKL